ncbi:MAG TPA: DNA gyrase inhibitor YacG [Aliidongia sp.]|nr:DNA gyrase inhibitor YacG [Aliidongia sp.]
MTDDRKPKTPSCVVCGKPQIERHRPFCSARCQQVDLGRWFTGRYAVPGEAVEQSEDGEEA